MKSVEPKVFLVGETRVNDDGLQAYLEYLGVPNWATDAPSDSEKIAEVMGRLCYRSFEPGLNLNVTKVRQGNKSYINHLIEVGHGSVLEHAYLNFIFADVSRVVTHELVRHRAGTAISQESLRFVRLETLPMYIPMHIRENEKGMEIFVRTVEEMERIQKELSDLFELDKHSFEEKKQITSGLRRIAPMGVATTIGWSCNLRTLRHVIEQRTDPAAEEEIRLLFSRVFSIVKNRYPNIFSDYEIEEVNNICWVKTKYKKV